MFECKYKLELTDAIRSAKYVYKSQKSKKDTVLAIMIPILMICMVGLLILDIVKDKNIVWDIILLVALVILEIMYLVMPLMLTRAQKKAFKANKLDEMDYLIIKIDNNICTETTFKDEQEINKIDHNLKTLTSFIEDKDYLILVFNMAEFVCVKKANLVGDINKLKSHLSKIMSKRVNNKK